MENENTENGTNATPKSHADMSHQDALELVQSELIELTRNDPLLKDVPVPFTLEEINSLIALEQGQAMTVNVYRADEEIMPIIVKQDATVLDLKHSIKRFVTLKLARKHYNASISWRYIWRTYWLYYEGQKLTDDNMKLKDYGIKNRDTVTFIKRFREN